MSRAAHPAPSPASEPRRRLRAGLLPTALGLGLAAVVLTGCGAGQITQTDTQVAAVNGASGQVGAMAVRGAELAYPPDKQGVYTPGSSAPLTVTIVNTGLTADTLTGIASPAAASITIDGSATGTKPIPGGFSVQGGLDYDDHASGAPQPTSMTPDTTTVAPTTTDSASKSTGKSTSTSPDTTGARSTGAPGTTPATSGALASSTVLPPAPGSISVTLVGLKTVNGSPLRAGLTIPLTFRFANAGEVTIYVPIAAPSDNDNPDTIMDSVSSGS